MNTYPQSEIEEENPCEHCTRDDCTGCPNQSAFDRMVGINELSESLNTFYENEADQPAPQVPSPQIIESAFLPNPPEALPAPAAPTRRRGRPKKPVDPSIPKRGPGAPKGNLNALKHGLYVNGCHVSNTTPFERAELNDLKKLIEFVKNYITKAYENGLTLKATEDINNTLHDISLASIALTRLLHTHNENSYANFPSHLRADDEASTRKLIEFYQNKVEIYDELTAPSSGFSLRE
jgi:hypothetical protein